MHRLKRDTTAWCKLDTFFYISKAHCPNNDKNMHAHSPLSLKFPTLLYDFARNFFLFRNLFYYVSGDGDQIQGLTHAWQATTNLYPHLSQGTLNFLIKEENQMSRCLMYNKYCSMKTQNTVNLCLTATSFSFYYILYFHMPLGQVSKTSNSRVSKLQFCYKNLWEDNLVGQRRTNKPR